MVYVYAIEKEGVKMVRTQIYLNQTIKKELNRISQNRRVTVSELIRQAIEQFLQKGSPKFDEAKRRVLASRAGERILTIPPLMFGRPAKSGRSVNKGLNDERLPD